MKIRSFKPKVKNLELRMPGIGGALQGQRTGEVRKGQDVTSRVEVPKLSSGVLRMIPLGGVGVVQKNMFVFEYQNDIVIIDCGVGFPDEGMPGVDLVIPDIAYLKDKKHKIRGIIITHAHDDHIGGLPYIWPELKVPIYSQKLTCGFIRTKFIEHNLPKEVIKTVGINDTLRLGSFEVSFYQVSHSVPDSTGIVLKTPVGIVIHQADFKIDWTPVNNQVTDVSKIARLGDQGVVFLTIDSLRAEKQGYTLSERSIEETFEELERKTSGKFLITLMTSNITRIQQAINVAIKTGRKVAMVGRSMENNFQVARDLGYLNIPPNLIIAQEEIKRFPDNKLMLVIAGSLGQSGSALDRVANNDHKYIRVRKGDTIVFSADPMPSAEVSQGTLIDNLTKLGCEVYASTMMSDLHVSGHAASEELKLMMGLIKPKFVMPMGGEFRHMNAFAKLARGLNYKDEQILLPPEGAIIEIAQNKAKINGYIETENVFVDGLGVGDVGNIVLRDRQVMSEEGVVVVMVPLDKSGHLAAEPEVISKGFVFEQDENGMDLLESAKEMVKGCLRAKEEGPLDWKYARRKIENSLEKFFYQEIKRDPLIVPVVVEV